MSAPTLFDAEISHVGLTRLVRSTDPVTSREAAERVKPGSRVLVNAIRLVLKFVDEPMDAFAIAAAIERAQPDRWSEASVRTAVSRAGLRAVDTDGISPRGQRCIRYSL